LQLCKLRLDEGRHTGRALHIGDLNAKSPVEHVEECRSFHGIFQPPAWFLPSSPNASSATIKPQKSFEVRLRVLRFGVILFNSRAVDRYSSRTAQRMILRRVRT